MSVSPSKQMYVLLRYAISTIPYTGPRHRIIPTVMMPGYPPRSTHAAFLASYASAPLIQGAERSKNLVYKAIFDLLCVTGFTEVGGSHVGEAPAGATTTRIAVAGSKQPRRPTSSGGEGAGVVPPAPSFFMPAKCCPCLRDQAVRLGSTNLARFTETKGDSVAPLPDSSPPPLCKSDACWRTHFCRTTICKSIACRRAARPPSALANPSPATSTPPSAARMSADGKRS
jgi:hypothetical protein